MGLVIFIGATGFVALCVGIWAYIQLHNEGKGGTANAC